MSTKTSLLLEKHGERFKSIFDDVPDDDAAAIVSSSRDDENNEMKKKKKKKKKSDGKKISDEEAKDDDATTTTKRNEERKMNASTTTTTTTNSSSPSTVKVFAFDGKRVVAGARDFGGIFASNGKAVTTAAENNAKTKRINVKREMKRFMASETKRIVREDDEEEDDDRNKKKRNKNGQSEEDERDDANKRNANADSKFGMKHMRREVRDFGIKGLNKWDRKELEDEKLKELGMKPSKGIRIPATIGVGLWKKNEQRKEEKRLDLFRLGHKLEKKEKKKMTNSEREEKREKESDRGLAWGSSWFKNGILKLKKSDVKKNKLNVDTKVRLSGKNRDTKGSKGGKKSKKGAKGSKKRGAGKKSSRG
jgi:hypothetical protein